MRSYFEFRMREKRRCRRNRGDAFVIDFGKTEGWEKRRSEFCFSSE